MGDLALRTLRVVLAAVLAGTLFVQLVMVPLLAGDLDDLEPDYTHLRIPLIVIPFLGLVTIQATVFCVWRLLTMVRRGTVFSHAAFRYVDVVMGALAAASLLLLRWASASHRARPFLRAWCSSSAAQHCSSPGSH